MNSAKQMKRERNTSPFVRADAKGDVCYLLVGVDDETISRFIIFYRMGKGNGLAVADGRNVNTPTDELVNEGSVVIRSHVCPTRMEGFTVKFVY